MTAREHLKQFVIKYTKDNFDALSKRNSSVDHKILEDLEKDKFALDWILSELLRERDFKHLGITQKSEWSDDNIITSIYLVEGKLIRGTWKQGEHHIPYLFEYVRQVAKQITVYEYEVIP